VHEAGGQNRYPTVGSYDEGARVRSLGRRSVGLVVVFGRARAGCQSPWRSNGGGRGQPTEWVRRGGPRAL
jgi:hypothetical protein